MTTATQSRLSQVRRIASEVLLRKPQCQLERTSGWDTFGMRGTCSVRYVVTASFREEQVVPTPFARRFVISNDRIHAANGALQLAYKDERSWMGGGPERP